METRRVEPIEGLDFEKLSYSDYVLSLDDTGCVKEKVGQSDFGHDIYCLKYGDFRGKPVVFIQGNIHGSEWQTAYWTRDFMSYLVTPPTSHRSVFAEIKRKFDFVCVPCLNPSGYEDNTRHNRNGIDINRNYSVYWDSFNDTPDRRKGSAPFSEPETRVSRDIGQTYKPLLFVDAHRWSGYDNGLYVSRPGMRDHYSWYDRLIREMRETLKVVIERLENFRRPMATPYFLGRYSAQNVRTFALTIEIGGHLPIQEQSRLGLTMLLLSVLRTDLRETKLYYKDFNLFELYRLTD